jgi:hypothetical protein
LSKIKTGAARTAVSTKSTNGIGITRLKVTVHIPDTVHRKQEKINKIYDILKPKPTPTHSKTAV